MDQTDYQILNLLQEDGRRSLRYIGKRVALSPSAVKERIHRLEDFGAISGYQAQIDRSPLGYHVSGFIFAAVDSKKYVVFCDFCAQAPEITAFYHMVGNFNVLLRFAVHDVKALDALVGRIKTFGDSRTSIELQTVFEKVDPTNRTVVSLYSLYYNSAGAPRTASPAFALSALP